jgi:hypothetical protein
VEEAYVNEVVVLLFVLVLAASGYAAGRMHGQFSYRVGYRFGYRQGYFDGDRSSWIRRRKELQAAVASVLKVPPVVRARAFPPATTVGTTYLSAFFRSDDPDESDSRREPVPARHLAPPRALADVGREW